MEDNVDCQKGPKISESIAKRVELKWQTKLTLDQLKEKSKNLLFLENCPKLSAPLTNKELFSQLNLQKNIQKANIALDQVTNNLLQDKGKIKTMMKNILDAIALMGHSLHDISTMRRKKIKPF